jgi:hypothetical protein
MTIGLNGAMIKQGEKVPWPTFTEGTLVLQSPVSDIRVNGMLQTSDFKRDFIIEGAGSMATEEIRL